ncbi:ECF RNA polymerase sigma factor SigK [Kocuria sp. LUK]|uniref:ECF RNA polymerase sigma factor SigK n=1 Tax=Kocuria sp. LUK TaxID=2897828 RepID=UPI001E5F7032|nr:ECF RNA polymerase sigma factor SigK [Kocuria sp. LUK]MCD1144630.1 ECF RNA polymerase sigma factor SigK [Kocuria sp. LUK]
MTERDSGDGPVPAAGAVADTAEESARPGAPGGAEAAELARLLRRSGTGDEAAFAALYDRTARTVYGLAVRVTRAPELAAEVVQEVYLMAWQQAARFDPERGTVLAWLCTLAHRRSVDRIRQVQRERDREHHYESRQGRVPADETWQGVEEAMETQEVRAGLAALTPVQREAVSLAYYEGCTHREVAARLEVPLGTAKARIRDGLTSLRTALGVGR